MYDSVACFMFIVKSSNVHEMDCLREETVPISVVLVLIAL